METTITTITTTTTTTTTTPSRVLGTKNNYEARADGNNCGIEHERKLRRAGVVQITKMSIEEARIKRWKRTARRKAKINALPGQLSTSSTSIVSSSLESSTDIEKDTVSSFATTKKTELPSEKKRRVDDDFFNVPASKRMRKRLLEPEKEEEEERENSREKEEKDEEEEEGNRERKILDEERLRHRYGALAISFLIGLFSSGSFARHDFVYEWSSKIKNKMRNIACGSSGGGNDSGGCDVKITFDFETDLCCLMCFVMFSPISIGPEKTCFTLFSEVDLGIYFDVKNARSLLDDGEYQYKEPERRLLSEERERYCRILRGCYKEVYVEYDSLPPDCQAFLAMLVKIKPTTNGSNGDDGKNDRYVVEETSRFRKFMLYASLVEMIDTYYHSAERSCEEFRYTAAVTGSGGGGSGNHDYGTSDSFIVENSEYMKAVREIASEKVSAALIHFSRTFSAVMTSSQVRFFDGLIPRECKNLRQTVDHFERVFYNEWIW